MVKKSVRSKRRAVPTHSHSVRASRSRDGTVVNLYIDRGSGDVTHVQETPSIPVVSELPPVQGSAPDASTTNTGTPPAQDGSTPDSTTPPKDGDDKDSKSPADIQKEKDKHHHKWTFRLVVFGLLLVIGVLVGTYLPKMIDGEDDKDGDDKDDGSGSDGGNDGGDDGGDVPPPLTTPPPPIDEPEERDPGAPRWAKLGSWLMLFGTVSLFMYITYHNTRLSTIKEVKSMTNRLENGIVGGVEGGGDAKKAFITFDDALEQGARDLEQGLGRVA